MYVHIYLYVLFLRTHSIVAPMDLPACTYVIYIHICMYSYVYVYRYVMHIGMYIYIN